MKLWASEGDKFGPPLQLLSWQAQFWCVSRSKRRILCCRPFSHSNLSRAYHHWKHPSLACYRYMIWVNDGAIAKKLMVGRSNERKGGRKLASVM